MILKQAKEKGVVILHTTKNNKKGLTLLNMQRFKRLTTDPTAATEQKIQKVLLKNKI